MNVVAQAVIVLINMIAPGATGSLIAKIIDALVTLVPIVVKEARDLAPMVKNIIAALRGNGEVSTEQLDQLDAMESQIDAAFDASDAKAQAEDDAAEPAA